MDDGYVLTSNRDEDPLRQTKLPQKIRLKNGTTVYGPIDALKGGTWIATDKKGRTACLLNGAFSKHVSKSTYRMSRGQFVLSAFEAIDFENYVSAVFLENIEPFTLLLVQPEHIQVLVWDGAEKQLSYLPPNQPYLWSSTTLYNADEHAKKEAYFLEEISKRVNSTDRILAIHGMDEVTPFVLKHATLQTVSITQVISNKAKSSLKYVFKENVNKISV